MLRQIGQMCDHCWIECPEPVGDREVDADRVQFAEIVDERGRVVGDHATAPAPEGPAHPLIVGRGWPIGQLEQAAVDPEPVAVVDVVLLRLVAVPEVDCLGSREVSRLAERETLQREPQVPSGAVS